MAGRGKSKVKNKMTPGGSTLKAKKKIAEKQAVSLTLSPLPPLPIGTEPFFDNSIAILSRQYDRDRDRVIERAKNDGVRVMVVWVSDMEKQQLLTAICKLYLGTVYAIHGIHPDNIDKTNKRLQQIWLDKVNETSHESICIGILTGLNLSKEVGTHFAQESLFRSLCTLSVNAGLPLIIHSSIDGISIRRTIEILKEEGWCINTPGHNKYKKVLIHNAIATCEFDEVKIKECVDCGFHFSISAVGLNIIDNELYEKTIQCIKNIPISQILITTDSPWNTPQNLLDEYLRTLRNEPCNIYAIINSLIEIYIDYTREEILEIIMNNSLSFYGLNIEDHIFNVTKLANSLETIGEEVEVSSDENDSESDDDEEEEDDNDDDRGKEEDVDVKHEVNEKEEKQVNNDNDIIINNNNNNNNNNNLEYYNCFNCRTRLFDRSNCFHHELIKSKTVFKLGSDTSNLCASNIFIRLPNSISYEMFPDTEHIEFLHDHGFAISGTSISCKQCNNKLGKYHAHITDCACGIKLKGRIIKLNSKNVDYKDNVNTDILARRSLLEDKGDNNNDDNIEKKKTKKIAKQVGDNRSNFSQFRNKNFSVKKNENNIDNEEEKDNDKNKKINKKKNNNKNNDDNDLYDNDNDFEQKYEKKNNKREK